MQQKKMAKIQREKKKGNRYRTGYEKRQIRNQQAGKGQWDTGRKTKNTSDNEKTQKARSTGGTLRSKWRNLVTCCICKGNTKPNILRNLIWPIDACCIFIETCVPNTCLHISSVFFSTTWTKNTELADVVKHGRSLHRALLALPQATLACSVTAKTCQCRKQSAYNQ